MKFYCIIIRVLAVDLHGSSLRELLNSRSYRLVTLLMRYKQNTLLKCSFRRSELGEVLHACKPLQSEETEFGN